MKKIININLSGRVIPIEDAAYENLQRYIESLRGYFANEEGRDEITNDIESRIAELMSDKITKGAAAITEADIEAIISSMGRVEDFEKADAADNTTSSQTGSSTFSTAATGFKRSKGRLYRDRSDKLLGGVCAGISSYLNIDPAIVRLLFAIITFGGFGTGVVIYILLWIILPAKDIEGYVGKRLFRNPENKIIGGVSGGIAAYFGKETWVVRIIFAAPLILYILLSTLGGIFNAFDGPNFEDIFAGSLTGTFILAYIVLWIVLPEARSPFEKMEMRGEKVDVNSIRQNVQGSMDDLKNRAQAWGEEVRQSAETLGSKASEFANTRSKTFAAEVRQSARPVASGLGHVLGVLFKSFFLFVAGVIAFALFMIVIVFTLGGIARPFNDFLLNGFWQTTFLWSTLVFFLAVPMIAIITWIVRRLMKVRSKNSYLGWTFGGLWTLGWVSLFLFIASMTKDWRYYNNVRQEVSLSQAAMNKMTIRVDEPEVRYSGTFDWINDNDHDNGGWDINEDSIRMSNIKIRVEKSSDSNYHVAVIRYSAGRNRKDASQRADKIEYTVNSIDSALILGSGLGVGKADKFRGQKVMVEVQVPVGKQLRFDESIVDKLNETHLRIEDSRHGRNRRDWDMDWDDDSYFEWKPNVDYTMTEEGKLTDGETPPVTENNDVYEYRNNNRDTTTTEIRDREERRIQEEIEKNERRLEEEQKKLEDQRRRLEDLKKDRERTSLIEMKRNLLKKGIESIQIKSPIFSMII
jgi:phage shock protein PspC (stress-responsive transcriptional regulator)